MNTLIIGIGLIWCLLIGIQDGMRRNKQYHTYQKFLD
jgi:hypothetical protein